MLAVIGRLKAAGAQGILITPSDTKAIVPTIKKARDAGLMVIVLDTPTDSPAATRIPRMIAAPIPMLMASRTSRVQ